MAEKKMFIADRTITIKSTDKHRIENGMIEKLDEMLNGYNITHFFTTPIDSTNGIANNDEDYLNLFYDEEDEMTVDLVYALWCKTIRHIEDKLICNALSEMAKRAA